MKVEAASISAAAPLAAPTPALSDEEYARRLYAELNGAILKTRRSAKLSSTQPKKDGRAAAASNDTGSTRTEQQQEEDAPPVAAAPAPAEASFADSTAAQPVAPAVADSKEEDSHLPAPAKKLTGLHRELQRLLGDPAPVRSSNNSNSVSTAPKPRIAGSATGVASNSVAAPVLAPMPVASLVPGSRRGRSDAVAGATSARQDVAEAMPARTQQLEKRGTEPAPAKAEQQDASAASSPGAAGKARTLRVRLSSDQQLVASAAPARAAAADHGTEERAAAGKQQQQAQVHKAAGGSPRPQGRSAAAAASHEGTASSGEAQQDAQQQQQQQQRRGADAAHKGGKLRLVPAPVAVPAPQLAAEPEAGARSTRSSARVAAEAPPPAAAAKAGASTASSPTAPAARTTDDAATASAEGGATAHGNDTVVVQPHKASFKRSRPVALAASSTPPTSPHSAPADAPAPKAAAPAGTVLVTVKAEAGTAVASEPTPVAAADDEPAAAPAPRRLAVRLGGRRQVASATDSAAHPPPGRTPSPLPHSHPVGHHPAAAKPAPAAAPPAASAASSKPRRIPKMPMVCDGARWYRAKVVQQRAGRVLVEFMGLEQAPVPFWLDISSDRIWTGSYKGKDWRYLGGGAWEPKRGATNGRHAHQRAGSRPAPAGGASGTTDKDSNSSAAAAGSDTDLGEDTGRSRREPAAKLAAGKGDAGSKEGEAGEQEGAGQGARRMRSSSRGAQQQRHVEEEEEEEEEAGSARVKQEGAGREQRRQQQQQQKDKEAQKEGQKEGQQGAGAKRQLRLAPTPSSSSQEHAATWHEPAADDSHSCEDGAVTAPPRKLPHLPPIDTTPPAPAAAAPAAAAALTATASCSADAGTTPHATSASTLQDPLLSCVASCPPDAAAAAPRPAARAPAAAEDLSAACIESAVVTSCAAATAAPAAAKQQQEPQPQPRQQQQQQVGAPGATSSRPSSPRESALPHRCRRKGKPMRACIDTEEERLSALSAASSDSTPVPAAASSGAPRPQDSHTGSSARPAPLLSAALLIPTSDDEPAAPTSHPSPAPAAAAPHLLSCTLSSTTTATAAQQDSCPEAPLRSEFAADSTPDDEEGAALLAALRQGSAAAPGSHPPAADTAPHPVHKKRRRGNGWTKIMRPSRPAHYYYTHAAASAPAASHWDDMDAPVPATTTTAIPSYHDSSTASHHAHHPHQPASPRSNPHPHPHPHPPTASSPTKPRDPAPARSDVHSSAPAPFHPHDPSAAPAPRFGEGSLSAAPASLPPSSILLPPSASHTSALRAALKRPWDTLLDTSLLPPTTLPHHASTLASTLASTSASCAAFLPAPAPSTLPPPFKRPAVPSTTTGSDAPIVSRVSAAAGLPSSLLSCLRQAPPIVGLAALPGLCHPEPLQLLMACPPKPPMPLFKPL